MSNEHFRHHFQTIYQKIAALQQAQISSDLEEITADLMSLQLIYEEMQTGLEIAEMVEENLLQQTQQVIAEYHHYYDLFHSSPIAHLVTDANGLILKANQAIAQLLNVPLHYLVGKPLAVFVAERDRPAFRTQLNQLARINEVQRWQVNLSPRQRQPFEAELQVAIIFNDLGWIESLRINVYNLSQYQQRVAQLTQAQNPQKTQFAGTMSIPPLPPSLDGLQVLIVDDEADARDFIAAVLASHGIRVTAVATTAAALETLKQFRPDVLVSDIRMPHEDGYSLIRKVRELEAQQGWHIPAAALTAYLTEDWNKALAAGFEAHLHKLAQPTELIELVAQLAGRGREF